MIFFGAIALVILYATFRILWPFLTSIILGAILVTLTFPMFRRVRERFRCNSSWAAIVMLLFITVVLILPLCLLGVLLVQQAGNVAEQLRSTDAQQILARLDLTNRLAFIKRIAPQFDPASISPNRMLLPLLQQLPGWVARNGATIVGGLAGLLVGFAMVLLSSYYFYVEGEAILEQLAILSPLPQRYDEEFASRFKDVIDATFRGQISTSLAQGFATGVGLAIARVPGSIFWGAVAAILSLLPMVGAAVVWVPATIYLFVSASMHGTGYGRAIFMAAWGVLVVSLIDNVVRPWAMKGKAQLPAIPLLFAVLGGMQAFGFVGLVLGPLVFSLLMAVVDIYKRSFRIRRSESEVA
jgi:predicted PurR-regulated permease PerM